MGIVSEKSAFSKDRKIVFFCGDLTQSGGTERVLSVIANGLAARGYPVFVISLWGGRASFFPLDQDIKIYWAEKEQKKRSIMGTLHYLTAVLRYERPDVLIDVDIILGCYSVFLKRRFPDMRWISWEHFNYYYHFRKNCYFRKVIRRLVCRCADELVVLTKEDEEYYQKNLNLKCGITQIYNPVPFEYKSCEQEIYEKSFSRQEERPMILAAGRLTKAKGFDIFIKSWEILESRYPEWSVVIAGEGEERKRLEKAIRKAGLKCIKLVGAVSNIEQYYREAAFFVLTSRDEGFGMVLLEAMCFSNPVVSYACKAGPKEIVSDGENGFLVEPGDVEEFAKRMELLMTNENLRRKMGEAAKRSTARFDGEKILGQWEKILYDLSKR